MLAPASRQPAGMAGSQGPPQPLPGTDEEASLSAELRTNLALHRSELERVVASHIGTVHHELAGVKALLAPQDSVPYALRDGRAARLVVAWSAAQLRGDGRCRHGYAVDLQDYGIFVDPESRRAWGPWGVAFPLPRSLDSCQDAQAIIEAAYEGGAAPPAPQRCGSLEPPGLPSHILMSEWAAEIILELGEAKARGDAPTCEVLRSALRAAGVHLLNNDEWIAGPSGTVVRCPAKSGTSCSFLSRLSASCDAQPAAPTATLRGIPPVALQGKWAPSLLAARDAARNSGAHDTAAAILRGLSAVGICLCGRGRSIRDPSGYTFRVPQCATAEDYEMAIVDAYAALPRPAV